MNDWIYGMIVPVAGWVISVEKRLAALTSIKETVDKTDTRVEKLVYHLIADKNEADH